MIAHAGMRRMLYLTVLLCAACGKGNGPGHHPGMDMNMGMAPQAEPRALTVTASPQVMQLYNQTCKACHGRPGSGAPQTGDPEAWAPRVAQGMDTLLDHTLSGYKGMPPLGTCGDCDEDDFRALIRYMAQLS